MENDSSTSTASKRRFGKKLYLLAAVIVIAVILIATLLVVPQANANILPLGVKYEVGEKLTYNVTSSSTSSLLANTKTTISQKSTLTLEIQSFDGEKYTISYNSTSEIGSMTESTYHIATVKQADMITFFGLLPVALQSWTSSALDSSNQTNPVLSAEFNQTEAKVGDTWTFPLDKADNSSTTTGQVTVTFKSIENLSVKAGTYKVFRMDITQNSQESRNAPFVDGYYKSGTDFVRQTYLEYGTCKQIQSSFQMNITSQIGTEKNLDLAMSVTSTLSEDLKP
jgi:hypothetical protein